RVALLVTTFLALLLISGCGGGNGFSASPTPTPIARADFSATTVDFGGQPVNTPSATRTVTLTNSGTAALAVSQITAAADYAQTNTCGSSVAAGGSCTISITFTPTAVGQRNGTLTVSDSALGSPHTVALTGSGTGAGITFSSTSLNFGAQIVNAAAPAQTITVGNNGTAPLAISYIGATGDFADSNTCGNSLAPGATCTVQVVFTPSTTGARNGTLTVADSASGSPHRVSLAGTGVAAVMSLSTGGGTLNFPNQLVNTTSAPRTVTLTNTGNAPLTVSSIVASGDFAQTNSCGSALGINASCIVSVTFTPTAMGPRVAALTLTDDAIGSPHVVPLTGTGIAPGVTFPGGSALTFATPQLINTTSAPQSITLTNSGNAPLNISGIVATGDFAQTNTCGTSLAPGTSCTIGITFTPTAGGNRSGSLTVSDDAAGSPQVVALTGTGLAPSLVASIASINFGDQLVGIAAAATPVTLSNAGTAPLTLTSISTAGDYSQTNNCPSSLAPGASCVASVVFTPTVTGVRGGNLTVAQSLGAPVTVSLTGNGTAPSITLSNGGGTLSFGNQMLNTTSAPQTLTLGNSGTGPLVITSITATGAFAQTNNCGNSLAVGATCTINVTFTPTATGANSGGLTLADNAAGSPQTVNLSGTGVAPLLSFSSGALDFGNVLVGTTSPVQTFTVSNGGSAPLSITAINAAADYTQTNNCGSSVAAGSSCTVNVTFNPSATGARNGSITIADNAAGSPHTVTITGTGIAPSVSLALAGGGSSMTFADQLLNTPSAPQTVTLTNSGTGPLSISALSTTGDYSQSSTCGSSVASGASCTINVTFTPTALGARPGTLTIADNAPGNPHTVALSGNGVMPVVTLSQTSAAFADQLVGTTSSAQTLTVKNTGTGALNITNIAAGGDFAQTNTCGSSLAAGASCSVKITFTPSAMGTRTGAITLTNNAADSPQTVSLSGNAIAPVVSLSVTSLTFPSTVVNTTSAPQSVTLTNSGTAALNIASIIASNGYSQNNNCGNGLPVGSTCVINLTFTPASRGLIPGTLTITDNASGSPHVVSLSGVGKVLTSILVVPNNPVIALGFTEGFNAIGTYSDHSAQSISNQVTWDSSNKAVATVNSAGFATSLLQGSTSITATLGPLVGSSTLTVGPPLLVDITVTPASSQITRGATLQLTATGTYSDNSTADVSTQVQWSSSDPTVVTVDNTGFSTGVGIGLADVSASLGLGSGTAAIRVSAPVGTPRFAYVANQTDNTVSIYTVDGNTGKLHNVSYAVVGKSPTSLAVAPSGNFVYVLDTASNFLEGYAIAATTGALTPIPGSPFATGNTPAQVILDSSGKFVFVSNAGDNTISVFTADPNTGSLTPVAGSPFVGRSSPAGMAVDTLANYLYVANLFGNNVSTYSVGSDGTLTEVPLSPFSAGSAPNSVTIDPSGRFVYVTNSGQSSVSSYSTNNGVLTPLPGSPFTAGVSPVGMAIDPTGQYAYVANSVSNTVSQFTITPFNGTLVKLGTSIPPTGASPSDIVVDSSGKYLYVSNAQSNDVTVYTIDSATGKLTNLQTVRARVQPAAVAVAPGVSTGQYTPRFAYVANQKDSNISGYNVDSAGNLTLLPSSPFATDAGPRSLALDFTGSLLFSVNYDAQDVIGYTIDPVTGALSAVTNSSFATAIPPESFPTAVAVDPSGRFAYVAKFGTNDISGFQVDPFLHTLLPLNAPAQTFPTGTGPAAIAIDPTGQFAYVACSLSNAVFAYSIDPVTGALNALATSPFAAGSSPISLAVDSTGKFVYTANFGSNDVSGYLIDPSSGALTAMSASPFLAGIVPTSITVDPSARFAFVTNGNSSTNTGNVVREFVIDPKSGLLSPTSGTAFATNQNPSAVVVDPSGHYAYVTNADSGNISAFNIDVVGGALTAMTNSPFPAGTSPESMVITGTVGQGFTISGTITPAANGAGSIVQLSGAATATTTADAFGNYAFTDLKPGNYTVTPSNGGFTMTPLSQNVTVTNANVTGTNFTAQ
ncbi:MAG: choice-of-anchor D domain-containing protein, partial [Acidobacteria bacterium]|nr:choice-of-anchor D domain-containing protein [Acidobacteriota bacterium]